MLCQITIYALRVTTGALYVEGQKPRQRFLVRKSAKRHKAFIAWQRVAFPQCTDKPMILAQPSREGCVGWDVRPLAGEVEKNCNFHRL